MRCGRYSICHCIHENFGQAYTYILEYGTNVHHGYSKCLASIYFLVVKIPIEFVLK